MSKKSCGNCVFNLVNSAEECKGCWFPNYEHWKDINEVEEIRPSEKPILRRGKK